MLAQLAGVWAGRERIRLRVSPAPVRDDREACHLLVQGTNQTEVGGQMAESYQSTSPAPPVRFNRTATLR
jgi:hypothetical protein